MTHPHGMFLKSRQRKSNFLTIWFLTSALTLSARVLISLSRGCGFIDVDTWFLAIGLSLENSFNVVLELWIKGIYVQALFVRWYSVKSALSQYSVTTIQCHCPCANHSFYLRNLNPEIWTLTLLHSGRSTWKQCFWEWHLDVSKMLELHAKSSQSSKRFFRKSIKGQK